MGEEGSDEGKALAHTARELSGIVVFEPRKTKAGKELPCFGPCRLAGTTIDL